MSAQPAHVTASTSNPDDTTPHRYGIYPVQLSGLEISVVREALHKQIHGLAKYTANQAEDLPEFERLLARLNATMAVIRRLPDLD